MTNIRALLFMLLVLPASLLHGQRVHIIPEPLEVTESKGSFIFNPGTVICVVSEDLRAVTDGFIRDFKRNTGLTLKVDAIPADTTNCILMTIIKGDSASREAYVLDVRRDRIEIKATSSAGIFYGMESLLQMISANIHNPLSTRMTGNSSAPCAFIKDRPLYPYRGMHLDVSRHYFPASYIKRYLDILAAYKINVFHWHLTDSHGWRMEIKKYPRLTSVGAWRADRAGIPMTIAEPTEKNEAATYGGFYTQEEIKEIVAYAKNLNIEIIPEIEMPGHCTAALVAYPQFSDLDNSTPLLMPCGYKGDLLHNFCAGYDSTYIFLQDILSEVMALFPSKYIHIGGDEVKPGPWMGCSRCRQTMKMAGLNTAHDLQAYFTHRIDSFITARGKRMMGWDEIISANIATSSVGMSWHGESKATEAAAKGNQVVMTPYWYTYFDFYQSPPALEEEITYAKLYLDSVYAFNPMPPGYSKEQAKYILGGEACLWTENVATPQRVEYMLLPRLLALSEALWSPLSHKNYSRFVTKVEQQFKRFNRDSVNYARSMYNVDIVPAYDSVLKVALKDQTHKYPIRFTTDGSVPLAGSPLYHVPVVITRNTIIKTATFMNGKAAGKINTDSFAIHKAIGCKVQLNGAPLPGHPLNDGIFGTVEPYDRRWFITTDSLATLSIDLKKTASLSSVSFRFMEDPVNNIYLPLLVKVSGSEDGVSYKELYTVTNSKKPQQELRNVVRYERKFNMKARYIKVAIVNSNSNDVKERNMILLDEIVVK